MSDGQHYGDLRALVYIRDNDCSQNLPRILRAQCRKRLASGRRRKPQPLYVTQRRLRRQRVQQRAHFHKRTHLGRLPLQLQRRRLRTYSEARERVQQQRLQPQVHWHGRRGGRGVRDNQRRLARQEYMAGAVSARLSSWSTLLGPIRGAKMRTLLPSEISRSAVSRASQRTTMQQLQEWR